MSLCNICIWTTFLIFTLSSILVLVAIVLSGPFTIAECRVISLSAERDCKTAYRMHVAPDGLNNNWTEQEPFNTTVYDYYYKPTVANCIPRYSIGHEKICSYKIGGEHSVHFDGPWFTKISSWSWFIPGFYGIFCICMFNMRLSDSRPSRRSVRATETSRDYRGQRSPHIVAACNRISVGANEAGCFKQDLGECPTPADWICAICLDRQEETQEEKNISGLLCSHVFHSACIRAWLSRGNKFCPLCRSTEGLV